MIFTVNKFVNDITFLFRHERIFNLAVPNHPQKITQHIKSNISDVGLYGYNDLNMNWKHKAACREIPFNQTQEGAPCTSKLPVTSIFGSKDFRERKVDFYTGSGSADIIHQTNIECSPKGEQHDIICGKRSTHSSDLGLDLSLTLRVGSSNHTAENGRWKDEIINSELNLSLCPPKI